MTYQNIQTLLNVEPVDTISLTGSFADEQWKDPALLEIFNFLLKEKLPAEEKQL